MLCCTDTPNGRFNRPATEPPTVIVLVEDEDGNFRPEQPSDRFTNRPEVITQRPQPAPETSTPFVLRPKSTTAASTPFVLRPQTSTLPPFTPSTSAPEGREDYDCKGPDGVPGNCTREFNFFLLFIHDYKKKLLYSTQKLSLSLGSIRCSTW